MFDNQGMGKLGVAPRGPVEGRLEAARSAAARAHLRHGGEARSQTLETVPALAGLFPGRGLRRGAAYSVEGSTALMMALLAGPSAAGAWCGVVGVPDLGAEAAAAFGINLERLVLVPHPGTSWRSVLGTLIDALTVVVAAPPAGVTGTEASRIGARLQQRGAVLVARGRWPQSEVTLSVRDGSWAGLGEGHGYLAGRQVTVVAEGRGTAVRPRRARMWLPGHDGGIRPAEEAPEVLAEPGWLHQAAG